MKKIFLILFIVFSFSVLSACNQISSVNEEQKQKAINLAHQVYQAIKQHPELMEKAGVKWDNGFCLANVLMKDWVADLVHNPRQPVDDDPKNQCSYYNTGEAHHFVELDLDGNLVRAM